MSFRRSCLSISCVLSIAAVGAALLNCKDDDNKSNPPVDTADASAFEDVVIPDSEAPLVKFQGTVIAGELRSQPSSRVAERRVYPGVVTQLQSRPPKLQPTAGQPPANNVMIDGMGCVGFKAPNPALRGDADMGKITIEGLSAPSVPKPFICDRMQLGPVPGVLNYGCNLPPNMGPAGPLGGIALPYAPVAKFVDPADRLVATIAGGADVPAIKKTEPAPPAANNLNVSTDLWSIKPGDVDGTKDFTIKFDCGGNKCFQSAAIAVTIISSDGDIPAKDAGGDDPYFFPMPKPGPNWGLVVCQELPAQVETSLTVKANVLQTLGNSWSRLFVQVVPASTRTATSDNNDLVVLGTGIGLFGISARN
ncbi:hypothetical protein [Pendulispora albinea]|uniref:Uncharacterized protein n=1 Tax=Pendulispora albinea TaxID=2741071 RepID=A0ABZ2M3X7_9BACT